MGSVLEVRELDLVGAEYCKVMRERIELFPCPEPEQWEINCSNGKMRVVGIQLYGMRFMSK